MVNLLRTNAYVDHTHEINSPYALVPIIVYCFDKGEHLTDAEIRKLVKWFYYSQIRTRYISQLPQKLDRDLRMLASPTAAVRRPPQGHRGGERRLEVMPYEFEGRATQHPLFSMVRWYLKSRGAVCFTTGMGLRRTWARSTSSSSTTSSRTRA